MLVHGLADFALQTHWQATNKWNDLKALGKHVGTYTGVWLFAGFLLFSNPFQVLAFALITGACHFVTDLWTSKLTHECFGEQDFHNGFVVIEFDQLLHYTQLFLTYEILK